MNISFEYLYRDASNYKNWGEVILKTSSGLTLSELERLIKENLLDGQNFVAEEIGVPTLYSSTRDITADHYWHEYDCVSWTDNTPTVVGSIEVLIERLSHSKKIKMPNQSVGHHHQAGHLA